MTEIVLIVLLVIQALCATGLWLSLRTAKQDVRLGQMEIDRLNDQCEAMRLRLSESCDRYERARKQQMDAEHRVRLLERSVDVLTGALSRASGDGKQ